MAALAMLDPLRNLALNMGRLKASVDDFAMIVPSRVEERGGRHDIQISAGPDKGLVPR
ncbi:MAG TPA: hypothetical protein VMM14_00500 [Acidimicrobiia bacterium]|nr:hypothetical protein [Acidimicrobiia bacterium]